MLHSFPSFPLQCENHDQRRKKLSPTNISGLPVRRSPSTTPDTGLRAFRLWLANMKIPWRLRTRRISLRLAVCPLRSYHRCPRPRKTLPQTGHFSFLISGCSRNYRLSADGGIYEQNEQNRIGFVSAGHSLIVLRADKARVLKSSPRV